MLILRLLKQIEDRLGRLAKRTGRTRSRRAKFAIHEFLDDQEDHLIATRRRQGSTEGIPLEEVERRLGLQRYGSPPHPNYDF